MEPFEFKVGAEFQGAVAFQVMKTHGCITSIKTDEAGLNNSPALFHAFRCSLNNWLAKLPNQPNLIHSYEGHVELLRRPLNCQAPLQAFCALWNADAALASIPAKVTLKIMHRADVQLECTNSIGLPLLSKGLGPMRVFDEKIELAALTQAWEAQVKQAKSAQKAAPVNNPVELPKNIRTEIAAYLRREYGESARDKTSVKAKDLVFEGEFVIDAVPTQFWRYPSSTPSWATVERFADHYGLGMGESHPEHAQACDSVNPPESRDSGKSSMPVWKIPNKFASEIKRNGIWADKDTWEPLWLLVENDFEIKNRILPVAWQVELETYSDECARINDQLELEGKHADGPNWSKLIRKKLAKHDAQLAKRTLDNSEDEICGLVVESEADCKALIKFFWREIYQ